MEEAKYLAQIYAWGLTLGTNHPRAKSLFPVTSVERREERMRESDRRKALRRDGECRGGREQGRRELRLRATLCISGREGRALGREGRKEGGRLSLHSSKLHWVTHPLLQPWLHAIYNIYRTERERGFHTIVLRNCVIRV